MMHLRQTCLFGLVGMGVLSFPGLFEPRARYNRKKTERVLVLTPGRIPTTDIYLKTRLDELPSSNVVWIDTKEKPQPSDACITDGSYCIIVRSAPHAWLKGLQRQSEMLSGVVYLMDDDIPEALFAEDLPHIYALRTGLRYAASRELLSSVCSEIWVSTVYLRDKYYPISTQVIPPRYYELACERKPPRKVWFYHGSAAHRKEHEWLTPIVHAVQQAEGNAEFEVIGNQRIARYYDGIPRVHVLRPMCWEDYVRHTSSVRYAVGVTPLLPSSFNLARSESKMFDIRRCQAVGLYTDVEPYRSCVIHGVTGWLLPNEPQLWIERIVTELHSVSSDEGVADRMTTGSGDAN